MLHYILPFFSVILGVASLFIDSKSESFKKWAWLLVVLILASGVGTSFSSYLDDKRNTADQAVLTRNNDALLMSNQEILKTTGDSKNLLEIILNKLQGYGILAATSPSNISLGLVQQSFAADDARTQALQQRLNKPSAGQTTIEYFSKDIDRDIVAKSLQEGGLTFNSKPPQIDDPTDAIWAGDAVALEDVKFVALTLVRAGIRLRAIRRFRDGAGSKAHLIEIGADKAIANFPVLTVVQIQNMTSVTRDTL